ncbi:type II toxin-antitoxin system VapC family toxin [Halobellus ordinarius]|uniref:type II toxin-antitoxin system VapC family toxin n=1 Tax=Halobellus ordinarius TaxID=3075120 RepID=UPI0028808FED|nr:PIN domain-containing protein [Halobellus sp. ZY16]
MIFLDSWIWLEYLFSGENEDEAEAVIQRANTSEAGGIITPTVLAEVSYRLRVVENDEMADEALGAIHDYEHIDSVPVIDEIAEYAAELRYEHYDRGERELSYADAIHLATAVVHDDCDALYSGDPDFAILDEIETVVL